MKTQVYLFKDVANVGKSGDIVIVADGFATNYILPRKLGVVITEKNKADVEKRIQKVEKKVESVKAKTSEFAEKIKSLTVTVKTKIHDDGKLYGAIRQQMIVDELAKQNVTIGKNMVVFDKQIKEKGTHQVTIKLSATLQPALTVKVIPE
jgi:large subunit ribosomal protein L9